MHINNLEQRRNIRNFVNRLVTGFPDSINQRWRYILFFKDVINGYAFSAPYLTQNKYHGRVILNIPRILSISDNNMEKFTSLILMNLYHETQHTYQFEYMKKNKVDIRNGLIKYAKKMEEQAILAMNSIDFDYDFSYIKKEG